MGQRFIYYKSVRCKDSYRLCCRYEQARKINPTLADKYVQHTTIDDPEADAMIEELTGLGRRESGMLLRAAMD